MLIVVHVSLNMAKLSKDNEKYWNTENRLDFAAFISPLPAPPETPQYSAARGFGLLHAAPDNVDWPSWKWDLHTKMVKFACMLWIMSLYEPIWASFTTGSKKCSLGKDEEFHSNLKTLSRTRAQFGSQTLCILRKEKGNSNTIPFYFPLFNYSFGFFSFRYSHHLPRSFGQ